MKKFHLSYVNSTLFRFQGSYIHSFGFFEYVFLKFPLAFKAFEVERLLGNMRMSIEILGIIALSEVVLIYDSDYAYLWIMHV